MFDNSDKIDLLKQSLSSATRRKLRKDNDGLKLRNMERQYTEELAFIEAEVSFSSELLKELKSQINTIRHQISMVEICSTSEEIKIKTHITDLYIRKRSFDDIFDRVRHLTELQKHVQKQSEDEEEELLRQREKETAEKVELIAERTAEAEKDCEAIERECAVLKKRNNAIMLKMRRKLIETENIRKDLLKKKNINL